MNRQNTCKKKHCKHHKCASGDKKRGAVLAYVPGAQPLWVPSSAGARWRASSAASQSWGSLLPLEGPAAAAVAAEAAVAAAEAAAAAAAHTPGVGSCGQPVAATGQSMHTNEKKTPHG